MDSIDAFAIEARRFERWLLEGTDQQADAAREGLKRLLELATVPQPHGSGVSACILTGVHMRRVRFVRCIGGSSTRQR